MFERVTVAFEGRTEVVAIRSGTTEGEVLSTLRRFFSIPDPADSLFLFLPNSGRIFVFPPVIPPGLRLRLATRGALPRVRAPAIPAPAAPPLPPPKAPDPGLGRWVARTWTEYARPDLKEVGLPEATQDKIWRPPPPPPAKADRGALAC
jgi:hypothetical protein